MDEPFGALDPIIRAKAREDLLALQRRLGMTIVLVTHDMEEAIRLGDRVAVMDRAGCSNTTGRSDADGAARSFVERLVGTATAVALLSLITAGEAAKPARCSQRHPGRVPP